MTCPEFAKYGLLYRSGELGGAERSVFAAHLKDCPECRSEWDEAKEVIAFLQSAPALVPSAECHQRIRQMIRPAPVRTPGWWHYVSWAGLTAAAVLLLTLVRLVPVPPVPDGRGVTIAVRQTAPADWNNGMDKEISELKYKIACFKEPVITIHSLWDEHIEKLEKNIRELSREIEQM